MPHSKYVDGYHDEPWAGLFHHENTAGSVSRMCEALGEFEIEVSPRLSSRFTLISDNYWPKKEYAKRQTAAALDTELQTIRQAANRLADKLENAPRLVRGKLLRALRANDERSQLDDLALLVGKLRKIEKGGKPKKHNRGRRSLVHLDYAIPEIAKTWQEATNQPFIHSFGTAAGRNGAEFISEPPRYVQFMARALDPELQLNSILPALKKVRSTDLAPI